jgi:hypothetical protein
MPAASRALAGVPRRANTPVPLRPGQHGSPTNGALLNLKSGRCLDDPSDSTVNGTQQQIWNCNTNPQQNWTLP